MLYSILYTPYSILYTPYSILHTPYSILYTPYSKLLYMHMFACMQLITLYKFHTMCLLGTSPLVWSNLKDRRHRVVVGAYCTYGRAKNFPVRKVFRFRIE